MTEPKNFVVLIGSYARETPTKRSDVDLVVIGRPRPNLAANFPQSRKITTIKYTPKRFDELYRKGDLFVFHILTEGKLLLGDQKKWATLVKAFRVRTQFKREIRKNQKVIAFLLSDSDSLKAPIAFLSNFLRAMKNIAIFRLAENREYEFAKDKAIKRVFPWIPPRVLNGMLDADHILTRENKINRDGELGRLTRCAQRLFAITTINQREIFWS